MEARKPGRRPAQNFSYFDGSSHDRSSQVLERGFYQQETGMLANCAVTNIRPKQLLVTPRQLGDEFANWIPFKQKKDRPPDDPLDLDNGLEEVEEVDGEAESSADATGNKRKRYASAHNANSIWREEAIVYLHELFRFDGLGDGSSLPCCHQCGTTYPLDTEDQPVRLFRCIDCHTLLMCKDCCIDRHRCSPLHVIEEWTGSHFRRASLTEIGLVYQLGHGGLDCEYPDPSVRSMVVIEHNGIHRLSIRYCNCVTQYQPSHLQQLMRNGWYPASSHKPRSCATFKCLDLFRALNVGGNVNAHDFITVLERLTEPTRTEAVPDRYKEFCRMVRQWAFLHRLKRAGVGITIKSLKDLTPGSLAVRCWACPWIDVNLPKKWNTLDSKYSYLYMPVLALDANFRLKNKIRAKEKDDPAFAPGSAYFVGLEPYKKFISKYVSEKDISTCAAFAALTQKDTKMTTGLKTSGVGGCACARHEIIRPNGLGDLQKGERYANMDYVFFSAILGLRLPRIGVSYDVVCQWKANLLERMKRLPLHLQQAKDVQFIFGLPTWHAVVHQLSCKSSNSLTYQDGVGRTDGEGIERIWSMLNPAGFATREMGEGNRHDTLDDRVDHLNFHKNLGQGDTLSRRLVVALEERDKQIESFTFVDKGLDPVKRARWMAMIEEWKRDRSKPCPFLLPDSSNCPTEDVVRAELKALEEAEEKKGRTVIYGTSALTFVTIGLELEELQRSIRQDNAIPRRTALQERRLRERREKYQEMLENFRELQCIYTPGAARAMENQGDQSDIPIEGLKLWLPSDFSASERLTACAPTVLAIETKLRAARCGDALKALQQHLHMKQHLIAFRNANVVGQRDCTKAKSVIDSVGEHVTEEAEKYRRSRQALLDLDGEKGEVSRFPPLLAGDIALDEDYDPDLLVVLKLGRIGSDERRCQHISTGKRTMSWIWTANGGPEANTGVDEYVRVEWSKAFARKERWSEEVERLREEMKMVLRYLSWQVSWWEQRMAGFAVNTGHPAAAFEAGMRAYCARQADWLKAVDAAFRRKWKYTGVDVST